MSGMLLGYKSKRDRNIFALCHAVYGASYICRLNFSSVIPALTAGGVFSESRIAAVSSAFFFCYGIGQIFSGILGDRVNTRLMVFVGSFLSALSNVLIFFFSRSYYALIVLWALNGLLQSMIWSPILRLAADEYDDKTRSKFGIDMASTVPIGTLLSYAVSLITMLVLPWQYVFLVCGLIFGSVSVLWFFGSGRLKLRSVSRAECKKAGTGAALKILLAGGAAVLIFPIAAQGTLKDSVTQWLPQFFSSQFDSSVSVSLMLTMILPIINVTGAYIAKAVDKKLKSETKTSAVFFAAGAVFLILMRIFNGRSLVASVISAVAVTNCMFAVNVMLITMAPLKFADSGIVSTAAGIFNSCAYIGCAVMNRAAGAILEHGGWNILIVFWLFIAVAAAVICFTDMRFSRKDEIKKRNKAG